MTDLSIPDASKDDLKIILSEMKENRLTDNYCGCGSRGCRGYRCSYCGTNETSECDYTCSINVLTRMIERATEEETDDDQIEQG